MPAPLSTSVLPLPRSRSDANRRTPSARTVIGAGPPVETGSWGTDIRPIVLTEDLGALSGLDELQRGKLSSKSDDFDLGDF